jgi:hypothetical protein
MTPLTDYILAHTERGDCKCGKCFDTTGAPDPNGHTVDMVFFKVAVKDSPSKEEFVRLSQDHHGEWGEVDPLDGKEHNYLELGGWIGDQGVAMMYMALGVSLGVFQLLSPAMLDLTGEMALHMAEAGLLSVQAKKVAAEVPA